MSYDAGSLMHYAMLIRLASVTAIGGFGVAIAILVPVLRLWVARLDAHAAHGSSQRARGTG